MQYVSIFDGNFMQKFLWSLCVLGISLFANEELKMKVAPFGSWKTPITGDLIVTDVTKFGGVTEIDGAFYFAESRPAEMGRTTLVRLHPDGSSQDLIPIGYNARTRVHEYGGGSLLIKNGSVYFSNFSDQEIYHRDPSGQITQLTHEKNGRFADGRESNGLLYYVMELHGETVENCLVVIDKKGAVKRIAEGADFYASPRISPDGKRIAYYCWNHPNMPWDGGELCVAELNEDGSLKQIKVVAGSKDESICQHSWGPDGRLYYISDLSGWWNLYCEGKPLYSMNADIGFPQWAFGQSFFDFWQNEVICVYSEQGADVLARIHEGKLKKIDLPFTSIKGLSVTGDHLYFVGTSPSIPSSLVKLNLKTMKYSTIKKSREASIQEAYISHPQAITFPTTDGLSSHAFYYPPKNADYCGLPNELPPLLVLSHGGPTAHEVPAYNLEIQYWTSRGIAVVDVNYGGSSGYGRAYRDRLKGAWGIVDVDDCTNAALYCVEKGLADAKRLCIAGGSAGGFTTLACLTFKDVFRAGASFFGVSDLEALTLDTHKFESRYLDGLVGPYPITRDLYIERSPIHHVDQIKCPIILLQGDEDKIVPPPQSEKMYQSLLERGIPTAYLLFEKEQHGFRQAANIKRSIEAQSYFFSKIFGYSLADQIEPVEIANFDE